MPAGKRIPLTLHLLPIRGFYYKTAVHMHVFLHLVPAYHKSGPMGAEHGSRGIFRISLRVITGLPDNFPAVMTGLVSFQRTCQPPLSPGIGHNLCLIPPHGGDRSLSREDGLSLPVFLDNAGPAPLFNIGHGAPNGRLRHFQAEGIPRFQKNAGGLHKPLAQGPVGSLPEISALRVLVMSPARHKGDLHICYGCPGQNPPVYLLFQVGQHQALPVPVQVILAASCLKLESASPLSRFHKKMDLRIMAKGLKMTHTLHGASDCLFIHDVSCAKFNLYAETLFNQAL